MRKKNLHRFGFIETRKRGKTKLYSKEFWEEEEEKEKSMNFNFSNVNFLPMEENAFLLSDIVISNI
jgi:hypothetical protein